MDDYLRNILNEFEFDDTIDEIDEIFDYLKENNFDNANDELNDLNLLVIANCSKSVNYINLPTPMGTNFFSIYNPIQSMNAIIPDIFKTCLMKDPKVYAHPVLSTRNSPKIKISFEDESIGLGASIVTRFQKLIPNNIIKAFLYFGYKSDFNNMDVESINFLEKKLEKIIDSSEISNSSYTDPNVIFNELYGQDTLIQNILELSNMLDKTKKEKADSTNIGTYNLKYLFTYYVIARILLVGGFNVKKYSNFIDKNTTGLSYSDLVYLNYLRKIVKDDLVLDNFLLLLQMDVMGTKIDDKVIEQFSEMTTFIKNNNIFILIDLALEVKEYILSVISYNLNKKVYNIKNYAKPVYLIITRRLYCNYAHNTTYNYPNDFTVPEWCV
tara:strand:+ start:1343 stop:2491 length:1149 start_codon:yes stop_codon:yes gene_type:complete